MKPSHPDHAGADEQAALWAARVDGGTLNPTDREALEAWLAESPARRELLAEYCRLSTDLEAQLPALVARGSVAMPPPANDRRRFIRFSLFTGAGLLAAAALVAVMLWTGRPATQSQEFTTAAARRQQLTLVDGTHIELNARTNVRVDFSRAERKVQLGAGQAYFKVTSDPGRPFLVETPAGSVRVTGTVFDVRTGSASELQVTVVEGSVVVRPGRDSVAAEIGLRAGHQLTLDSGAVSQRAMSADEVENTLAWRTGFIVFNGVPLDRACATFAQHHGIRISVRPEAAAHRVAARYNLDDLDGFIGTMTQLFPIETVRNADGIVVVPRVERSTLR